MLLRNNERGVQQQDVFHNIRYPSAPYHTTPSIPPTPSVHEIPVTRPRSDASDSYSPTLSVPPTPYNMAAPIQISVYGTPVIHPRSGPPGSPVSPEMPYAVLSGGPPGPAIQGSANFTAPFQHTRWAIPPMPPPPRAVQYSATGYNTFNQPLPDAMQPPAALPPMGPYIPGVVAWPMPPGALPYPARDEHPRQYPTQQPAPIKVRHPSRVGEQTDHTSRISKSRKLTEHLES